MEEIEKYYQLRGQEIVDMLFDKGYIAEGVTRQDLRAVEDLIAYLIQSNVKSGVRSQQLVSKLKETGVIK